MQPPTAYNTYLAMSNLEIELNWKKWATVKASILQDDLCIHI